MTRLPPHARPQANRAGDGRAVIDVMPAQHHHFIGHPGAVRHQGDARPIAAGDGGSDGNGNTRRGARGDIAIFSPRIARYQFAGFSTSASISTKAEAARAVACMTSGATLETPRMVSFAAGVNDLFQPQLLIDIRRHDLQHSQQRTDYAQCDNRQQNGGVARPFFTR